MGCMCDCGSERCACECCKGEPRIPPKLRMGYFGPLYDVDGILKSVAKGAGLPQYVPVLNSKGERVAAIRWDGILQVARLVTAEIRRRLTS